MTRINGYFTWRPVYINDNISLLECDVFQKKKLYRKTIFSENRVVYKIMGENTIQPDRPQLTIYYSAERMWFAHRITKASEQTHNFSGAIIVALFVRCTSCWNFFCLWNMLSFRLPSIFNFHIFCITFPFNLKFSCICSEYVRPYFCVLNMNNIRPRTLPCCSQPRRSHWLWPTGSIILLT